MNKPDAVISADSGAALAGILGEVLNTSSVNRLIGNLVPGVLAQWAGKNPVKKKATKKATLIP